LRGVFESSDGKKNGPSKEYYEAGELMREGTYKNDQLDGDIRTFYLSRKLKSRVHYDKGILNDVHWREYYEIGALLNTVSVIQGKKEGLFKQFYPDGHIKMQGLYKNDKREGVFKTYSDKGWLWYEESYVRDLLIKRRAYNAQGHLVMEQIFYK